MLSGGLRLLEFPLWDSSQYRVGGETLLATHDAYYWVAGAEGRNDSASGTPMAALLKGVSLVTRVPPARVAFWLPALLAALVAIPIALWAVFLGWRHLALPAAMLGSLAPAYYTRSRLGFYDTDWAALFFPLLCSWLLAERLRPALRRRVHLENDGTEGTRPGPVDFALPVAAALGLPWHRWVGLYLTLALWIAGALAILLARPASRARALVSLLPLALVVAFGAYGLAGGLVLLWLAGGKLWMNPAEWRGPLQTLLLALLVALLVGATAVQSHAYLLPSFRAYIAGSPVETMGGAKQAGVAFPEAKDSIQETQRMGLASTMAAVGFIPALTALGMLGLLGLMWNEPAGALLLPLTLLGTASLRLGARFAMFAVPTVALGCLSIGG